MIEEDVNVELLPLGNQNEGHEYVVAVRFRAVNADVALKIAEGIQEQLPSAGVSPWCPVTHS